MRVRASVFIQVCRVLIYMSLVIAWPRVAAAQNVGTGPLTRTLIDTAPTSGVINWGAVKFAPGLVIEELGVDENVFDEKDDPKKDWVFRGTPDVSVFWGSRFVRVSAYAGAKLAYYKKFADERSVGHDYRGRLDGMMSRLHPFIGGGESRSRARPNGEIDTRADQRQRELSGGIAYDLGPHAQVYGASSQYQVAFFNAVEDGIPLSTALNRTSFNYSVGVKTDLTPLAALTLSGAIQEDRFDAAPIRNSDNRIATAAVRIGAEAFLSGNIAVSLRDFKPVDPQVQPYRGVSAEIGVTYPFLEVARLSLGFNRNIEYSFDATEAYYQETTANLSYTHRLFNQVDFQLRGSKSVFDYGFREGTAPRRDTLEAAAASLGYNLRNRTRIALNYEMSRRQSPAFEERNYDRSRVYFSWAFAF